MRKLRRIRAEKGLTMDTLEERTGVSKRTISEIERGMRTPQTLTLAKLANALDVELDDLLEEEAPKKVEAPSASGRPEGETVTVGSERTALWDVEELLINAMRRARKGEDERKIAREVARSIEELRAS